MQIQGVRIAITMAALVVALTTTNTLMAASGVGIQLSAGGLSQDQVASLGQDTQEPEVQGVGSQDPGFLGVALGVTRTIQQLITLTTATGGILTSWGVPSVVAYGVQIMIDLAMGIAVLQVIARFKF